MALLSMTSCGRTQNRCFDTGGASAMNGMAPVSPSSFGTGGADWKAAHQRSNGLRGCAAAPAAAAAAAAPGPGADEVPCAPLLVAVAPRAPLPGGAFALLQALKGPRRAPQRARLDWPVAQGQPCTPELPVLLLLLLLLACVAVPSLTTGLAAVWKGR